MFGETFECKNCSKYLCFVIVLMHLCFEASVFALKRLFMGTFFGILDPD